MKSFLYEGKTIEIFKRLKSQPPQRILSDEFYHVGFDYEESYILATPKDFSATSQNGDDEAIIAEFIEFNSPYKIHESERVIYENPEISRLWILRTLLYFTDHMNYKSKEEALARMTKEEKEDKVLSKILSETTGGHEEIVCNPQSKQAAEVNKNFANLVDAGILLEINGEYLGCFSNHNGFSLGGQIWSFEEITENIIPFYQLIEIDY